MSSRALLILVIGLVAACQAPASRPTVEVTGVVQAGPVCPVARQPPDPACADRPVAGAVLVVTENGNEVARASSAADGSFHLRLAPGEYQLAPQSVDGLMGTAAPLALSVRDGESPPPLIVAYDTGIR